MKTTQNVLATALLLAAFAPLANAQVKFKLSRTGPSLYQVSLVPEQTLDARRAVTGTMQVSLKVKADAGFVLADITSLQPEVEWDKGTVLKSPDGARSHDYISVALRSMATRAFAYQADQEVPLFTFRNAGTPVAEVQLLDNATEPLAKAAQNRYNVLNHISVLGFGMKNAYTGNLRDDAPTSERVGLKRVFPNPASTSATVVWENYLNGVEGDVVLGVSESGNGRTLLQQTEFMRQGVNQATLNVGQLNAGVYLIHLQKDGEKVGETLKLLIVR